MSWSSLSIKVIGSKSLLKKDNLFISTCYLFVCGYGHYKGQGQIKVISKTTYSHVGGLHLTQIRSCSSTRFSKTKLAMIVCLPARCALSPRFSCLFLL